MIYLRYSDLSILGHEFSAYMCKTFQCFNMIVAITGINKKVSTT